jgi:hypothetical protein
MKCCGVLISTILLTFFCNELISGRREGDISGTEILNENGAVIRTRFLPPKGFQRVGPQKGSFGKYLQNLPLKSHGSPVFYYNGKVKLNAVHAAVIKMDVGKRDLQQCADAIMRLRAEYLWKEKKYDQISFNFTNGFPVGYAKWKQGFRVRVQGNRCFWKKRREPSNTYGDLRNYLIMIFRYAGTYSLSRELIPVSLKDLQIGDVFIQGGFPGHAVIVVDAAVNGETGEKVFLLAQSYMPAQEIHILKNPENEAISPWYSAEIGEKLETPEWSFTKKDLKRFQGE